MAALTKIGQVTGFSILVNACVIGSCKYKYLFQPGATLNV
jgi:lipoprotein